MVVQRLLLAVALALTGLLSVSAHAARAEKRIALVVGNAAYRDVPRLTNPTNDARLIATTLQSLGFQLVGNRAQLDLDKAQFDRAVQEFGNAVQGADVALFYYAGHGLQARGVNYLVPVDANPSRESDFDFQMLNVNLVLRQMEDAQARLNLVVLDACRNNPFGGRGLRSAGNGLARMQAPEGTLISFATQPGNVALDGGRGNSPFTRALAQTIRKPGLDIFRAFNEVGLRVSEATRGRQQPWLSLSPIQGDFYFAGAPKPVARPAADPVVEQRTRYEAAERIATVEAWDSFLRTTPSGFYADLARAQRDKLVATERARAAAVASAKADAEARTKAAALERARREAAAKAAQQASDQAAREAAARQAARAKAAQEAFEKAAREAAEKAAQEAAERAAQKAAAEAERRVREAVEKATAQHGPAPGAADPRKVATVTPSSAEPVPQPRPVIDPTDLARLLKLHLQQIGCDPGAISGDWNDQSRHALMAFNKYAGTHLDVKVASLDALETVRARKSRVCPLSCGRGTRLEGDRCVAITCERGRALGDDGKCHAVRAKAVPAAPAPHQRRERSSSGAIALGSARHLSLRSACRGGNTGACQTLCNAGPTFWRACRAVRRRSRGGEGRFGRFRNFH